ncbi:MFS transporter [Alteromonas sediminis]|uniref:MFS transporter n=1 Tax=Alteromonas sediminis TaxID=2259342 RepID=A0A3N5Y454_9ALTE|nr:MFS transporter [Alteromonas sediminis]
MLSLTYLLYFGQLGILTPYLGIFLDGRGFSSADIGTLFALITLTRIIGPSLWAGVADKHGNPLQVMQLGSLLTVVLFAGVFFVQGFWWLTLVFALMMMFWTAVLPQLEVITLQHLKPTSVSYGKIRLWGSVGFIVFAVIVGQSIDVFGSETPIYVSTAVLALLFIATLYITPVDTPQQHDDVSGSWTLALKKPFVVFIVSSLLLQMSFGTFYGFFALYMRDLGYDGTQTGLLIALGVLAEVGIFLVASRIIIRFGVRLTLFISLALTAIRWWALGFAGELWLVVIVTQLLHALSFGLTHATSVHFIHHFFPHKFQSRGQAIYISLTFGIGGAVGHFLSGQLWQDGAGAELAFGMAGAFAMAGALLLFLAPKKAFG